MTTIKVNGKIITIANKSTESFDTLNKESKSLESLAINIEKSIEALNIVSNIKAMESFGYKSTEGVGEKIKEFFRKIGEFIKKISGKIFALIKNLLSKKNKNKDKVVKEALSQVKPGDESSYKQAAAKLIIEESKLAVIEKRSDPFLENVAKQAVSQKILAIEDKTQASPVQALSEAQPAAIENLPVVDEKAEKIKSIIESNVAQDFFKALGMRSYVTGSNRNVDSKNDFKTTLIYAVYKAHEWDEKSVDGLINDLSSYLKRLENPDEERVKGVTFSDYGQKNFIESLLDETSYESSVKALQDYDNVVKFLSKTCKDAEKYIDVESKKSETNQKLIKIYQMAATITNKTSSIISAEGTARVKLMSLISSL